MGYESFLDEAKKEVGSRSKPRIGKYVAKQIILQNKNLDNVIPHEFIEIIEKITQIDLFLKI